jgi:small-conductance mechanosensitive channel
LLDKSIKPGDVVAVAGTYGWVNTLGGRYVSVVTRDGIEHLIPNEEFITTRVENWTHSDSKVRIKIPIGIHYARTWSGRSRSACAAPRGAAGAQGPGAGLPAAQFR